MNHPVSRTRTAAYSKNLRASLFCHFITLVMSFVSRSVFIACLGREYLGLSGLFTNVLSVLSLAELGIGQGIAYTLYKPLARNDTALLCAIMSYFRRAYRIIGAIIALLGLAALPFLGVFIRELPDIPHFYLAYVLYVVYSAASYFFIPKRLLVIYDQRMYVTSVLRGIFYTAATASQILVLVTTGNYILYLIVRMSILTMEDLAVSMYADRRYRFLNGRGGGVSKAYKKTLLQNTKALLMHKIGRVLCRSTDSIIISAFLGLSAMGMYSNYALILGACSAGIGLVAGASGAGVGNLGATSGAQKNETVFRTLFFVNFWLNAVCAVTLLPVLNDIIGLWLGRDMVFSSGTAVVILLCFFLSDMRDPCLIFRASYGLFHKERYKPIAEAALNVILSLALIKPFGVAGVYLGTMLAEILACVWFEPYILYKHGFRLPLRKFAMTYVLDIAVFAFVAVSGYRFSAAIPGAGLRGILRRGGFCFLYSNSLFLLFFCRTRELRRLASILRGVFFRLKKTARESVR